MAEYRLSLQAEADVLSIYEWTEQRFGPYQAEAYSAGLERSFGLLADFPRMGTAVEELLSRLRRFRFQSHYIFYTEEAGHVLIRTLIHVKINLRDNIIE